MKTALIIATLLLLICTSSRAQESRYAGDFLKLGAGARALGLGNAYVAISNDATAVYWNPAGLTQLSHREIHLQHAEQFGGSINHDMFAFSLPVLGGGAGLGIVRIGVDDIALTALEDPTRPLGPDNRPIIIDRVGTTDYVLRIAYGRKIARQLHLGATLKIARRDLSIGTGSGFGLDLGLLYHPRSSIALGATLRDLPRTTISFPNGITDRISPSLILGIASMHTVAHGRLTASISAHLNDEKSSEENAKSLQMGLEYLLAKRLAFRLGLQDSHLTAGTGLSWHRFGIDLAFLQNDALDNTYRLSAAVFF